MNEALVIFSGIFASYGLACFGYGYSLGRRQEEKKDER